MTARSVCRSCWSVYGLTQRLTKSRIMPDAQCVDARVTKSLGCTGNVVDVFVFAWGYIHSSPTVVYSAAELEACFASYAAFFSWYCSSVKPCQPKHLPVGLRPQPHSAISSLLFRYREEIMKTKITSITYNAQPLCISAWKSTSQSLLTLHQASCVDYKCDDDFTVYSDCISTTCQNAAFALLQRSIMSESTTLLPVCCFWLAHSETHWLGHFFFKNTAKNNRFDPRKKKTPAWG